MLKVLFSLVGVIPLLFINASWHLVHIRFYLIAFLFILLGGFPYLFYQVRYFLGCDVISFGLILLSFWICGLIVMASQSVVKYNYYQGLFLFIILFLMLILYCTFRTHNLFLFYLFFEASLIPTLFLILGWGYQPERVQAGIYLLFYTLLASLPLLVGIFYIYTKLGSLFIPFLTRSPRLSGSRLFYLAIVFAFLVKIPIFLVHL